MYAGHVAAPAGSVPAVADEFERAAEAIRAAGIEAQAERNGVGPLPLTLKGEAVHDRRDDDGPWITVVADERPHAQRG